MGNCPPLPSQDPDQIPVNPERWQPKPWLQNEFTKSSQAETPMNHCQSNQLSALPTPRSPFETKLLLKFLEKQTCLQLKHVTQPFFCPSPLPRRAYGFWVLLADQREIKPPPAVCQRHKSAAMPTSPPAGPRVRLKTVDPPKGNGLGKKKDTNFTTRTT